MTVFVQTTLFNDAISGSRNWSDTASWTDGFIPDSHSDTVVLDNPQGSDTTLTVDGVYHIEGLTSVVSGGSTNFSISNGNNASRILLWNTPNTNKEMNLSLNSNIAQRFQCKSVFPDNAILNINNSGSGFHLFGQGNSITTQISANNLTINFLSGGITMDSINSSMYGGTYNISGGSLNYRYNSQALGNLSDPMNINFDNKSGSGLTFNNFTTGTLNEIPNDINFISSRSANFNIQIYGNGAVRFTGDWSQSQPLLGNIAFGGDSALSTTRYYQIDNDLSGLTFTNSSYITHNSNGGYVVVNNSLPSNKLRIGNDSSTSSRAVMYGFRAKSGISIPNDIEIYVSNGTYNNTTNGYGIGSWDVSGSCYYTGQILLNANNRTAQTEKLNLLAPGTSTSTYSQIISGSANCNKVQLYVDGTGTNVINNLSCGSDLTILPGATLQISGSWNNPIGTMTISGGNLNIPSAINIYNLNCATSGSNIFINTSGSSFDAISVTNDITADGYLSFPDISFDTGTYDIISYIGTLTDNGIVVGTNNTSKSIAINMDTINKKIQAVVT